MPTSHSNRNMAGRFAKRIQQISNEVLQVQQGSLYPAFHRFVVGAPAFMRGKERFSAPGNSLDSIMRFSAGNARAVLYGLCRPRKVDVFEGYDL